MSHTITKKENVTDNIQDNKNTVKNTSMKETSKNDKKINLTKKRYYYFYLSCSCNSIFFNEDYQNQL